MSINLQALVSAEESSELAAKDAEIAAKNIELQRLNAAIDHCGILGDSTNPYDWVATTATPLDLTGYVETFRDDFLVDSIMDASGSPAGGKWYSPARQNFGGASFLKQQITVANGQCRIRCERVSPPSPTSDWGSWRTGHMQTMNSQGQGFSQRGGYFEARIKLPSQTVPFGWVAKTGAPLDPQYPPDTHGARGAWPALWLLSANEFPPYDTNHLIEVDMFEAYGSDANLHGTVHLKTRRVPQFRDPPARQTNSETENINYRHWDGQFHNYGVLYEDDFLTCYFDGLAVYKYEMNKFLDIPMYVNLTLALKDEEMWKACSPMDMYIEHVRVLKKGI